MKNTIILGLIVLISGCGESKQSSTSSDDIRECVRKGVAYYKEIGSYPTLKSENISAEEKSLQKCENSLVAFDSL